MARPEVKTRLLFVCVENSCRSQLAEAFARALGGPGVEAWSAGSRPSGAVNAKTLSELKARGLDPSGLRSKGLDALPPGEWDAVVTMGCGDACPALPARLRLDWALPDPKSLPPEGFRALADRVEGLVRGLLQGLQAPERGE